MNNNIGQHPDLIGTIKKKEVHSYTDYLTARRKEKFILCHPGGIYAIVETADASNCIDACVVTKWRMQI